MVEVYELFQAWFRESWWVQRHNHCLKEEKYAVCEVAGSYSVRSGDRSMSCCSIVT